MLGDRRAPSITTVSYRDAMDYVVKKGKKLDGAWYYDTYNNDYLGNVVTEKTAYSGAYGSPFTNQYTRDYSGRVLSQTNAGGQTSSLRYDWLGNVLESKDPKGSSTVYAYDNLGRKVKESAQFAGNALDAVHEYSYDANGNLTLQRVKNNQSGASESYRQTGYEYDARNQLVKTRSFEGSTATNFTQYYYDASGNMLRMYTGLSSPLNISGLVQVSRND